LEKLNYKKNEKNKIINNWLLRKNGATAH